MTSFKTIYVHLLVLSVYLICLVSCSRTVSDVGMIMRDELEGLWKEVVLPYFNPYPANVEYMVS